MPERYRVALPRRALHMSEGERTAQAQRIWRRKLPAAGTPGERILWLMGSGSGIPLLVDYRWNEVPKR